MMTTDLFTMVIGLDWAVFYVPANTVQVIWETVLQVKRPNQQYQSTMVNDRDYNRWYDSSLWWQRVAI